VALLLATTAALEGGQLVLERPGRQEPRLLDVLQDGGHGRTGRLESLGEAKQRGKRMDGEGLEPSRGQWPSPPALSPLPDLSLPSAFGVDRGWRRRRYVYVSM